MDNTKGIEQTQELRTELTNKFFNIGKKQQEILNTLTVCRSDIEILNRQLEDIESALIDARITATAQDLQVDVFENSEQEIKAELMK